MGFITNVEEWYQKADIFAFTSSSEGFPNALAEAMACGCACISYDCVAGPADLITHEFNGLLIEMGNQASYIKGLEELTENTVFRKVLQKKARNITEKFKFSQIVQTLTHEIDKS